MRLIDADALLERILTETGEVHQYCFPCIEVLQKIKESPTATSTRLSVPVKIDGFKLVEDIAQNVLGWTYKGKSIKEWADSISEPKTNADRIRAMTDEELAWFIYSKTGCDHKCMHWKSKSCSSPDFTKVCGEVWLEWLKQKSEGE